MVKLGSGGHDDEPQELKMPLAAGAEAEEERGVLLVSHVHTGPYCEARRIHLGPGGVCF